MNKLISFYNSFRTFLRKHLIEITVIIGTFIIASAIFLYSDLRFPNDDQFIQYRYIENIASGYGFVYNRGERVLGTTAPLFILIAAVVKFLFSSSPTPSLVAYINLFFLSLSAIVFYRVCTDLLSKKWALVATAIFALNLSRTIPEGMETPVFLFFALSFIYCLLRKKYYVSSIFLALSVLIRPDAGLIAVLTIIFWYRKLGLRSAMKLLAIVFAITLPWLIFSTWYFGSFIPQSLLTKSHADVIYNLSPIQGIKVQSSHISRIFWGKIFDPDNLILQIFFNLLPIFWLVYFGLRKKINNNNWLIFAVPLLYFASFSISNPIIFPWYWSQMEPMWILMFFIGLETVISRRTPNRFIAAVIILIILSGPMVSWIRMVATDNQGTKLPAFKVAAYINENIKPNETIGLADIGIVGFITNAYIIDFIGLIRSDSVSYYPIRSKCADPNELYIIPPDIIKDTRPNWLVAGEKTLDKCFYEGDWFKNNYTFAYQYWGAKVWKFNN